MMAVSPLDLAFTELVLGRIGDVFYPAWGMTFRMAFDVLQYGVVV